MVEAPSSTILTLMKSSDNSLAMVESRRYLRRRLELRWVAWVVDMVVAEELGLIHLNKCLLKLWLEEEVEAVDLECSKMALGFSRCHSEDQVVCNFNHFRQGHDSVEEINSLEEVMMTMVEKRGSKISMFKKIKQGGRIIYIILFLGTDSAKGWPTEDGCKVIKLKI